MRMSKSTSLMSGDGGMELSIVGMKATKARTNTAIVASLEPKPCSWKKTQSPISPRIHMGMKTVRMLNPGCL